MKKSCPYCGRIHEKKFNCGKRPQKKKLQYKKDSFRSTAVWQHKREEIKQRDNYMCQVCFRRLYQTIEPFNAEDISVHHNIPLEEDYEKRLDNDNLITLCGYHHELAENQIIPRSLIREIIAEQTAKAAEKYPPGVESDFL